MSFFLILLLATVLSTVLAVVCVKADEYTSGCMPFFIGICSGVVAVIGLAVIVICGYDWKASEYKAKILNAEYGTRYSQEEVFFASSVIETVRQLDRQRIELKADLKHEVREPK